MNKVEKIRECWGNLAFDKFCGIDFDVTEHGVFVYPEPS